jgi:hypothetical protein
VTVKSSDSEIVQQGKQEVGSIFIIMKQTFLQELPRKAANAWKPKRSAPPKDEEEQKYDVRIKIRFNF